MCFSCHLVSIKGISALIVQHRSLDCRLGFICGISLHDFIFWRDSNHWWLWLTWKKEILVLLNLFFASFFLSPTSQKYNIWDQRKTVHCLTSWQLSCIFFSLKRIRSPDSFPLDQNGGCKDNFYLGCKDDFYLYYHSIL